MFPRNIALGLALFAAPALALPASAAPTSTKKGITSPLSGNSYYKLACTLTTDAKGRFLPSAHIRNTTSFTLRPGTQITVTYETRIGYRWRLRTKPAYVGNRPIAPGGTLIVPGASPSSATVCEATVFYPNDGRTPQKLTH